MPPKTSASKAQEKTELELRKLTRLEGNKTCVDCPEKMPGYVNLTHHTFVCTRCSGIHRELQFKVKGISMSVFTAEDVAEVAAIGNTKHNDIYMAKYSRETVLPNGSDVGKLREFIKTKYTEKKWYQNGSSGNDSNSSSAIPAEHSSSDSSDLWGKKQSSTSRMPVLTKEAVVKAPVVAVSDSFGLDLLDMDPISSPAAAVIKPQVSQLQQQFNNSNQNAFSGGFDAFGGQTSGGFDAFGGQETQSSSGFDAFAEPRSSDFGSQQNQAAAPQQSSGFDAFGGQQSSAGFDAFGTGTAQPQQNQQINNFGQQPHTNSGFGDFSGGSVPSKPMPFIKVSPPTAEEKAAEEAILAAAIAKLPPKPKNFNAFDEIAAPPVMHPGYGPQGGYPGGQMPYGQHPSVNPFEQQGSPMNPFGGPPGYGGPGQGPQGNPFGVPMQQYHPGFYPGMPPQGPGPGQGMPPQGPYGFHPQGPPGPYGYPPQPQGYPYGYPPNGMPQGPGGPGIPVQQFAPKPAPPPEPVAPDPFSTVGGLGWGEVSKPTNYHPTANTISATYHPPTNTNMPAAQVQQQPQQIQQPELDLYGSQQHVQAEVPAESGNPFDLF